MSYLLHQVIVSNLQTPDKKQKEVKHYLRRNYSSFNLASLGFEPSDKKTLVFCDIDALFMYGT